MFDTVKYFYDLGIYKPEDVKVFVVSKLITSEEYKLITGLDYLV